MYTNIHTTVGTATLIGVTALTGSVLIGSTLAVFSHSLVDLIGEARFKGEIYYELLFLVLFLAVGYKLDMLWWFIGGSITGNLFDIIDKKFYLSIINLDKYPYTYYFHRFKVLVNLTEKQTKIITIVNITLITIMMLF